MPIIEVVQEMRPSSREKALKRQRLIIEKYAKVNIIRQKPEKKLMNHF